jgi:uncharacterized Zn-binding protein involved in type VI secretion
MTRPVACLGFPDSISKIGCCTYPPNTVIPIINKVLSVGSPEARVGDVLIPVPCVCDCKGPPCPTPLLRTIIAVSKILSTGRPTAHVGDLTAPVSPRIILGVNKILAS